MKKSFFVGAISALILLFVKLDLQTISKNRTSTVIPILNNQIIVEKPKMASTEQSKPETAPSKSNTDPTTIQAAAKEAPSLFELSSEYYNLSLPTLELELAKTKERLKQFPDVHHLTSFEIKQLVTEVRRQGVLAHEIARHRLEAVKRKYL